MHPTSAIPPIQGGASRGASKSFLLPLVPHSRGEGSHHSVGGAFGEHAFAQRWALGGPLMGQTRPANPLCPPHLPPTLCPPPSHADAPLNRRGQWRRRGGGRHPDQLRHVVSPGESPRHLLHLPPPTPLPSPHPTLPPDTLTSYPLPPTSPLPPPPPHTPRSVKRFQDPMVESIERRISVATRLPVSHQEEIQVLRYTKGQKYSAHYDSAYGSDGPGPHERLATFYM
jgi:hypothetical protein